jgi:2-polyprenyl-3-methyl-5-hydroxy-6-metoxy-1,4-benzoquinol methylase
MICQNSKTANVKSLEWTEDLIHAFWDGVSGTAMDGLSFGFSAGPQLVEICRKYIPDNASILDYGSGKGDFLKVLIEEGFRCSSFDVSRERSSLLERLLTNQPNYLGSISGDDEKTFDVVFCNEVLEHIPQDQVDLFTDGLVSRVALNGFLIVTTPNNENLDDSACLCPRCMHTFHRWQHVNSFTIERICDQFEKKNFETVDYFCTDFSSSARALSAWRMLEKSYEKTSSLGNHFLIRLAPQRLIAKLLHLYSEAERRINLAKKAWELIIEPEKIKPKPRELYGSGCSLIYIGRRIAS